jgi:signal transduction histidine kinase
MRRSKPLKGLLLTIGAILLVRILLSGFGLPFNLGTLPFFSSKLYSHSWIAGSLGDLFINILLLLWLVVFITRHMPYKQFMERVGGIGARYMTAFVLMALLAGLSLFFLGVVRSLVMSPGISFDVSHFYAVNAYTVPGLLAIGALTGITCMIIYLFNVQFTVLLASRTRKYALMLVAGLMVLLLSGRINDTVSGILILWLWLFVVLLDIRNFTIVSDLFEPHMIFWAVFICGCCTGAIDYFNQMRERQERLSFVEQRLSPHRDTTMENAFDRTAVQIIHDKGLRTFMENPTPSGRKAVNQKFETQYLTGPANRYQARVYLFSCAGDPLYNRDTTDLETLVDEKNSSAATGSEYLFYKESILDRHFYLSYIPVYADSNQKLLGFVIVDLDLKKRVTETVYPELLQPAAFKASASDNEYAWAVYVNGKLITQTNDYPFGITLDNDTLKEQQSVYVESKAGVAELFCKVSDKRTVVVVHYHSELIEAVTLFSYLFGVMVMIAILILLYRLFLTYFTGKLFNLRFLNLRRRIHLSMLMVILVSFAIIGSVTILFFMNEYRTNNAAKLQSSMQVAKQSVQDYLKRENAFEADYLFDSVSRSTRFKYFINAIANDQKIDINIFDDRGTLFSTSQDEIYEKGLISRKIRPDAYYRLTREGKSLVIQQEQVAGLSYLSAYQPLRDEDGVTLGYISVPFFSSQKDINYQISNIVVTLINLYAFIFLVSGVITVIITRWLVGAYNIFTRQFENLNLQKNERLNWPYDDEIGKLVQVYNRMVHKVEEQALMLARSERESAWREMARQVAHEIKNPLTPMKLNIQYLQQAIRNNNPNIRQLADRVSESVIEQIDNLSYIASEFSNFAKMPEAHPEDIDLCALLENAAELYRNVPELDFEISRPAESVWVYADRSQLIRVFTNLLENAKQAIPEDRRGAIRVGVELEGDEVVISIADNGIGISGDEGKKIFQPYFTTKTSGTGLGLALTRKIIESWDGAIWFESVEQEGTTFFVRLRRTVASAVI